MWVGQRESLSEMSALAQLRTADIAELPAALRSMASQTTTRMLRETDPGLAERLDGWRGRAEQADAEFVVALSELRLVKDVFEIEQLFDGGQTLRLMLSDEECWSFLVGFQATAVFTAS